MSSDMSPELTARLETIVLHENKEAAEALLMQLAAKVNELMSQHDHLLLAEAAGEFIDAHQFLRERNLTDTPQVDFLNLGQFSYEEPKPFIVPPEPMPDPRTVFAPLYYSLS